MTPTLFRLARAATRMSVREVAKDASVPNTAMNQLENEESSVARHKFYLILMRYYESKGIRFVLDGSTYGIQVDDIDSKEFKLLGSPSFSTVRATPVLRTVTPA